MGTRIALICFFSTLSILAKGEVQEPLWVTANRIFDVRKHHTEYPNADGIYYSESHCRYALRDTCWGSHTIVTHDMVFQDDGKYGHKGSLVYIGASCECEYISGS